MDTNLCLGLWPSRAHNYGCSVQGSRWGITPSSCHALSIYFGVHAKPCCATYVWANEWIKVIHEYMEYIILAMLGISNWWVINSHSFKLLFSDSVFQYCKLTKEWCLLGVMKGQKSFENGSWSYAIDYGVGGKSPLEPSFNFCVELTDNSKVLCLLETQSQSLAYFLYYVAALHLIVFKN